MTAGFMLEKMININTKRVIANRDDKLELSYADVPLDGNYEAIEWQPVSVDGIDTDRPASAMLWQNIDRLYVAIDENIYISNDMGESIQSVPIFTGSNRINDMKSGYRRDVWAAGENNTILFKPDDEFLNYFSSFEMRTGPADGGHFTTVAHLSNNNGIFAGNGTTLYRSIDQAQTVDGWKKLKNFAPETISDLAFTRKRGYLALSSGTYWSTDNDGRTWHELKNEDRATVIGI